LNTKLLARLVGLALLVAPCVGAAAGEGAPPPPPPRELSAAELKALLAELGREMGAIKTLKTAFAQEKHLSLFSEPVKLDGWCLFARPDSLRLEFTAPFKSALIAQGKSVAKYEFTAGKWQKLKLQSPDVVLMVTGQIAAWLQGRFDQEGVYAVSARSAADGRITLVLAPKPGEFRKYIAAVELGLSEDKKRLVSVTIREPGGDYTLMAFSREERDVELPKEIFATSGSAPADLGKLTEGKSPPAKPEGGK
jgi:outer membrane lipoprotein-sorting protein